MARVVKRKDERILPRLADEFEQLAAQLNSRSPITMEIGKFTQACRLVSPLIRPLGVAMKFADIEYSAKATLRHSLFLCGLNEVASVIRKDGYILSKNGMVPPPGIICIGKRLISGYIIIIYHIDKLFHELRVTILVGALNNVMSCLPTSDTRFLDIGRIKASNLALRVLSNLEIWPETLG